MWVSMIRTKSEAFTAVKNQVESEGKFKLKILRTDRGGEFNSRLMNSLSFAIRKELRGS